MAFVVAPLLHNSEPVNAPAVSTDWLLQLLTTEIVGAVGLAFTVNRDVVEFTVPPEFVQTARYLLLLSPITAVNVYVPAVAPAILLHVVPSGLLCHCTVGAGAPLAAETTLTL